jgi:NADH-quinone oxidoreductase subunit J
VTLLIQLLVIVAASLGGVGVYMLMPRGVAKPRRPGIALALAALGVLWVIWLLSASAVSIPAALAFYLLASLTVIGGVMTVTQRSPISCAVWFASVVVGTAGLFLLQNAQFLAVAVVIVYAGAIVVMFLFVIMMAQQSGLTRYDAFAREPALGAGVSFVLLAALVSATVATYRDAPAGRWEPAGGPGVSPAALLDNAPDSPQMASLGTVLFSEHWFSVEVAGTLLLVAMVGAIVIASRRKPA